MSRPFKIILAALLAGIAVVVMLIAYLLFAIDPNSYKPQIEQAAKDQGVELDLQGDIGWSLFPRLALKVDGVHFSSEQHRIPPSAIQSTALELDLGKLLAKKIAINALRIDGADLHFSSADQTAVFAAPVATPDDSTQKQEANFAIAIDRINIDNSKVTLHGDGDSGNTVVTINTFSSAAVRTDGSAFPLEGDFAYDSGNGNPINIQLKTQASYNQPAQELALKTIEGNIGGLDLTGNVTITRLVDEPAATGNLAIESNALRQVLAKLTGTEIDTSNPEALQKLALTTGFAATADKLNLNDLQLNLDDSQFNGEMALSLTAPRQLQATISGSSINVDDYLAPKNPAATEQQHPQTGGEAALFAPLLAPLAVLDGGKGNIQFAMNAMIVQGIAITSPQFTLHVDGKRVKISDAQMSVFGGDISARTTIDLSGKTPQVSFNKQITNIDIQQAQQQFADNASLSGSLSMNIQGSSSGDNQEALLKNLGASGNLAIANPKLAAINLEQSYCELAALVEKTPAREEPWPKGTSLNDLQSTFTMQGPVLQLEDYTTGVGNLRVHGGGTINIEAENFAVQVITNLQGDRTSESGCAVKSTKIRNKDIPLLCKDSFAKAGAGSCKPDPDFVKKLLQKELLDKLIDSDDEESDKTKAVKGLLKGIFGG